MPQTVNGGVPKDITTGIAITVLIFACAIYLPIIGFMGSILIPLPALFYRLKLGRNNGMVVPLAAMIIMITMLGGVTMDLFYFGGMLLTGFCLGEFMEKRFPIEPALIATCGVVLLSGSLGILFYSNFKGIGLFDLISKYVAQNLELTLVLYEQMGMPEESIHLIAGAREEIQYLLVRILPGLITASTLFTAWINLLAARPFLIRKQVFPVEFGNLSTWKAPEQLVWGAIGCGILLLLGSKGIKMAGINGLIVLMTIYFFQGMAIISYFFEKKKFPPMLRVFLYGMIVIQQFLLIVVVGLGFFDMWLNFRKLETNKNDR